MAFQLSCPKTTTYPLFVSPRRLQKEDTTKIAFLQPLRCSANGVLPFRSVYTCPSPSPNLVPPPTTDICDANASLLETGELRALPPIFQSYGCRKAFFGPVVTLKVFEDNLLTMEILSEKGNGRVLVIDGSGSRRTALLGGILTTVAGKNGWAGIVVNGYIRDVDEINSCDIGVRALGSHPVRPSKKGVGQKHVRANIAGTTICEGEWLYADNDGVLISPTPLSVEDLDRINEELGLTALLNSVTSRP